MSKTAKLVFSCLFLLSFIGLKSSYPTDVYAQSCTEQGSRQWPTSCRISTSGDCVTASTAGSGCRSEGSACVAYPENYVCGFDSDGNCDVRGDGRQMRVSCTGGGGGGGGSCPACPAGQHPVSYSPPRYFCPNPGGCTTINRLVIPEEVCGTTINGNDKVRMEQRYCAPNATPTPVPRNPLGHFDSANCTTLNGWAFDPDAPSQSINVTVWRDGPGGVGAWVGQYLANSPRQDINTAYGISGNHGFVINVPPSLRDGTSHSFYIYAVNVGSGQNVQVGGSPKSINCPPPNTPTSPPPSCSITSAVFSIVSTTAVVGTSRTATLTVNDNPSGCVDDANFTRSNANVTITSVNPDSTEPFSVSVRCDAPGTTTVTGQARKGGVVRASDTFTITCTATATPTPTPRPTNTPVPTSSVCAVPAPRDPPATTCGNPGSVTWEWNDVGGANQYNLVIQRLSGGTWSTVQDYGWLAASTFTCQGDGVGVCRRSESRVPGTYRSRIRSRNTVSGCTPSGFSTSSQAVISACTPTPTVVPGCVINSAAFSGTSVSVNVNATRTLTLSVNDSPAGCTQDANFTRSNTNLAITSTNPDSSEAFTTTIRCDNVGTTTLTGQARTGGVVRASDTIVVNCTAGPTPTSTPTPVTGAVCTTPAPRDPPVVACGNPGTVTWEWNDVANVNQYNLVIQQLTGGVWSNVTDYGWQNASAFNCEGDGVGTCSRLEARSGGPFRSRIRARNTNAAVCTTSAFSNSQQVTVSGCSAITLPDIIVNGSPACQTAIVAANGLPANAVMNFSVIDPLVASANPTSDTPAYQTDICSLSTGTTTYTATANDSSGNPVSDTATITVNNPRPWCQAKEGDVVGGGLTQTGNISCPIPPSCATDPNCEPSIIASDSSDRPGVVVSGGSIDNGSGQSSRSPYNWTVQNNRYQGSNYDFAFFEDKSSSMPFGNVPANVNNSSILTGLPSASGYRWGRSSGNITIGNINLGSSKVVLLVDGDVNIQGTINFTDGTGFFLLIASGDITVDSSVGGAADSTPDLKGIYFADGVFDSGTSGSGDSQLHVLGTVVSGGFNLQRDLTDNSSSAAEFFEFAPNQYMQFPALFARKQVVWREVAP